MSTEKSVRQIIEEWNARAKAAGQYLDRDPWSVPPAEGSLLDVPETAESQARIASLRQQLAALRHQQREQAAATEMTADGTRAAQAPSPENPPIDEQPYASDHV
jgi:hypothetical protein